MSWSCPPLWPGPPSHRGFRSIGCAGVFRLPLNSPSVCFDVNAGSVTLLFLAIKEFSTCGGTIAHTLGRCFYLSAFSGGFRSFIDCCGPGLREHDFKERCTTTVELKAELSLAKRRLCSLSKCRPVDSKAVYTSELWTQLPSFFFL